MTFLYAISFVYCGCEISQSHGMTKRLVAFISRSSGQLLFLEFIWETFSSNIHLNNPF